MWYGPRSYEESDVMKTIQKTVASSQFEEFQGFQNILKNFKQWWDVFKSPKEKLRNVQNTRTHPEEQGVEY